MKMGYLIQYQSKAFRMLVFLAFASICGSVITQGVIPTPRNIFSGIVNERTLGEGVKAELFELNHMVVTDWGHIYVGAVNRIYALDSDLSIISEAETGPVNDSRKCLPGVECSHPKNLTDNYNKVLIHYQGLKDKILTCGSVYQGACEARNLKNISRAHTYYESEFGSILDIAVAANDPVASTVAFVATGPPEPDVSWDVLYVGATYTGGHSDILTEQLRGLVPAISTRNLNKNRFELIEKTTKLSGISVKKDVRSQFLIKYITGFISELYSYFLTQQPSSPSSPDGSPTVSKIVQICQEDMYYNSYIDMPLVCRGKDNKDYNYLQAARVTKASQNLQLSFGLRSADDILIGVFSDHENDPDANSAVCVFTMQYIRKRLLENVQKCYSGEDLSGGGYLTKKQCRVLVSHSHTQQTSRRWFYSYQLL